MANIATIAKEFYSRVAQSEEGKKLLSELDWEQDYQFQLKGSNESFYVRVRPGKLSVAEGTTPEKDLTKYSVVASDKDALIRIFEGKLLLNFEENDGAWVYMKGYRAHRSLISVLTRIGRDSVIRDAVNSYSLQNR